MHQTTPAFIPVQGKTSHPQTQKKKKKRKYLGCRWTTYGRLCGNPGSLKGKATGETDRKNLIPQGENSSMADKENFCCGQQWSREKKNNEQEPPKKIGVHTPKNSKKMAFQKDGLGGGGGGKIRQRVGPGKPFIKIGPSRGKL